MVNESEFKTRFGAYIPLFLPNTKLATEVFTTSPRNCVIVLHEFRGVLWECYHTVWCKYAICKNFTPYHLSIYLSIRFITSLFMDLKKKNLLQGKGQEFKSCQPTPVITPCITISHVLSALPGGDIGRVKKCCVCSQYVRWILRCVSGCESVNSETSV